MHRYIRAVAANLPKGQPIFDSLEKFGIPFSLCENILFRNRISIMIQH